MRNILYVFVILFTSLTILSCEKGEKLTDYEELVTLQFDGLPNGTKVFRNGAKVLASGSRYKVPVGEATYSFENAEGKVVMEQELDVSGAMTITVFESGEGLLLVSPIDDVEVNPTKLKVDIANLSSFNEGKEVTLAFYRMNMNIEVTTEATYIDDVKPVFTDEFVEVDFGDLTNFENGEGGLIYLLDENREPYRRDGLPVVFTFGPIVHNYSTDGAAELDKVYKIILKEEDFDIPLEGPFGAYPEGFYMCTATVLLSK